MGVSCLRGRERPSRAKFLTRDWCAKYLEGFYLGLGECFQQDLLRLFPCHGRRTLTKHGMLLPKLLLMFHGGVVVVGHRRVVVLVSNRQHDNLGINAILNREATKG